MNKTLSFLFVQYRAKENLQSSKKRFSRKMIYCQGIVGKKIYKGI